MFGFLKDKLKQAVSAFSKSAEAEVKEEKIEAPIEEKKAEKKEKAPQKSVEQKKPEPKAEEKKREEKKKVEQTPTAKEQKVTPAKHVEEKKKPEPAPIQKTPQKAPEKKAEEKHVHKEEQKREEHKKEEKRERPLEVKEEKRTEEKKIEKKQEQPTTSREHEAPKEEHKEEKKGFFSKLFGKKEEEKEEKKHEEHKKPEQKSPTPTAQQEKTPLKEEEILEEKEIKQQPEEEPEETTPQEETKGFLGKLTEALTKRTLSPEKFDEIFWDLEVAMLENNVAIEVIEKIKSDLRDELTTGKVSRGGIEEMIRSRLRQSVEELFDVPTFDLVERIRKAPKPYKICVIGVNGSGKTTTLAKIIHLLQQHNLSVVVAASDTFRAAAIDQLREHTDRLGVKLISQGYGADPAAVAFDAIKHAEAKQIDVVLIDTAGRLHSNTNLMQELEKVVRVAKPDLKLFVGEAITGNDCVEQATVFGKLVGIDAMILSKADIDEKGGAAISVSYVTGKPILYFGMGQRYEDLVPFDKKKIIESLEL